MAARAQRQGRLPTTDKRLKDRSEYGRYSLGGGREEAVNRGRAVVVINQWLILVDVADRGRWMLKYGRIIQHTDKSEVVRSVNAIFNLY